MKILIAGDFYPADRLAGLADANPEDIFGSFSGEIKEVDLAIVNLEAPLCIDGQPISKTGPNISAHPAVASFLKRAGFNLVTLANNHIFDYGTPALFNTMEVLRSEGVAFVGAGKNLEEAYQPFLVQKRRISVAILNFAENEWSTALGDLPGAAPIDPVKNYRAIQKARVGSDHVVVICHGGHETYPLPSPRMKELFHFYVDAGASAVINHHTHCVSGYEIYKGAPIFYSLGNFLFDRPYSRTGDWTEGIAVELELTETEVNFEVHHFSQCTDDVVFSLCDIDTKHYRTEALEKLNAVITDDDALVKEFSDLVDKKICQYRRYLEPSTTRLIEAAQSRGLLPSLLSRKQKTLLLNLIRCESHREIIIEMLERDVGNPR